MPKLNKTEKTTKNDKGTTSSKKGRKPAKNHGDGRTILYPYAASYTDHRKADNPITVEEAMRLLDWQVEPEDTAKMSFGSEYLLKDMTGRKIRCGNNLRNRPLYMSNVMDLVDEILYRRWKFNFESIIIGETGLVVNGQHTLIAIILAEQKRTGQDGVRWADYWDGPVTVEKAISYGCLEDDDTINTMDTAKPRDVVDVVYRSSYFRELPEAVRRKAAKMTKNAMQMLWHRCGLKGGQFKGRTTNTAALQYLNRHEHLLMAVNHILREDNKDKVKEVLPSGAAAAALYLMGSGLSDGDVYHAEAREGQSSERSMDWSLWDKACEFWSLLCADRNEQKDLVKRVLQVHETIGMLADPETGTVSRSDRMCVLAKAWLLFQDDQPITKKLITPERSFNNDTDRMETDDPTHCGGIDLGEPGYRAKGSVGEGDDREEEMEEMEEAGPEASDLEDTEDESELPEDEALHQERMNEDARYTDDIDPELKAWDEQRRKKEGGKRK